LTTFAPAQATAGNARVAASNAPMILFMVLILHRHTPCVARLL
jgi:hypothetical protein